MYVFHKNLLKGKGHQGQSEGQIKEKSSVYCKCFYDLSFAQIRRLFTERHSCCLERFGNFIKSLNV